MKIQQEMKTPVVVIGAGVAGLRCAQVLAAAGVDFVLLEKSDGVGGRIRTDSVDGFRLDRGFQVFQTAYPEAQTALDYSQLQLKQLEPGAMIFTENKWVRMTDPWRRPQHMLATLLNPIGTPMDRWRLLRLRRDCVRIPSPREEVREDVSTRSLLIDEYGFSQDFVTRFMQPWLSGIFLETELSTSAHFFQFIFRMISRGDICYPATGIQAIPDQMLAQLAPGCVRLNTGVDRIEGNQVLLDNGESIKATKIVLATDLAAARKIALSSSLAESRGFTATRCTYFSADEPPVKEATLMLNGSGVGPINHVFVMTNASVELAPPGKVLISVSSVGEAAGMEYNSSQVKAQMSRWFGTQTSQWRELATYSIATALPAQPPGFASQRSALPNPDLILCGDYCETASLNGALKSGRLAAEAVLNAKA